VGLGLEPITDDASAHLAIFWPLFREAVVGNVVALDAERVPNDLGGEVAVVAVDRLLDEVSHARTPSHDGWVLEDDILMQSRAMRRRHVSAKLWRANLGPCGAVYASFY